jgi:hypothetical protein
MLLTVKWMVRCSRPSRPTVASQCVALESYLVYAEEMRTVARVQAFRDFLVAKAQRWTY